MKTNSIRRNSKKVVATFLAVLMVMTSWVFFAPQKASAVDSGNYKIRIQYYIIESCSFNKTSSWGHGDEGTYKGWMSRSVPSSDKWNKKFEYYGYDDPNCAGISVTYKTNNGEGTEQEVYWGLNDHYSCKGTYPANNQTILASMTSISSSNNCDSGTGAKTLYAEIPGFPVSLFNANDCNNKGDNFEYKIFDLSVYNYKTSQWVPLFTGWNDGDSKDSLYTDSLNQEKFAFLDLTNGTSYIHDGSTNNKKNNWEDNIDSNAAYKKNGTNPFNYAKDKPHIDLTSIPDGTHDTDPNTAKPDFHNKYLYNFPNRTLPKNGSTSTSGYSVGESRYDTITSSATDSFELKDQYGVTLSSNAIAALTPSDIRISSTATTGTISFDVGKKKNGAFVSEEEGRVIQAQTNSSHNNGNGGAKGDTPDANDTQTVSIYARFPDPSVTDSTTTGVEGKSAEVKIGEYVATDAKYTVTWHYKDNGDIDKTKTETDNYYHGAPVNASDEPVGIPHSYISADGDWKYTLKTGNQGRDAWIIATDHITADRDMYAQYDKTVNPADYRALKTQIDRANLVMAENEYEQKYTDSSRATMESALAAANNLYSAYQAGNPLPHSQQGTIDNATNTLFNTIPPQLATYLVAFADEHSAVKGSNLAVNYGTTLANAVIKDNAGTSYHYTDPAFVALFAKPTDNTAKYTFSHFVDEDGNTINGQTRVTKNMIFTPVYTAENHTADPNSITVEAATCQHGSRTVAVCSGCGETFVLSENNDKKNHEAGDTWFITKQPTCTTPGEKVKKCVYNCGTIMETEPIPAGHNYNLKFPSFDAPDLSDMQNYVHQNGKDYIRAWCSNTNYDTNQNPVSCNSTKLIEIGHKWEATGNEFQVDQTHPCTSPFVQAMHCTVPGCGATYNEFKRNAPGHNLKVEKVNPSDNTLTIKCTNCNFTADVPFDNTIKDIFDGVTDLDFDLALVPVGTPTCQQNPQFNLVGSLGGEPIEQKTITIPSNLLSGEFHDWEACYLLNGTLLTDRNGKVRTPDCNDVGNITVKVRCKTCGEFLKDANGNEYQSDNLGEWGHQYSKIDATKPTCTTPGSYTLQCGLCGQSNTFTTKTLDPKGHSFIADDHGEISFAELKNNGLTVNDCTAVNKVTCQNADCGEEFTVHQNANHNWVLQETTTVNNCRAKTISYYKCSDCEQTKVEVNDPAFGTHNWVSDQTKQDVAATCEHAGIAYQICSNEFNGNQCGVTRVVITDKINHTDLDKNDRTLFDKVLVGDDDCSADANPHYEYICKVCGKNVPEWNEPFGQAVPHTWQQYGGNIPFTTDGYNVLYNKSCEQDGLLVRYCSVCGRLEYISGDQALVDRMNNSNLNDVTYTFDARLSKFAGHNFGDRQTTPPTCTDPGFDTLTCQNKPQGYYIDANGDTQFGEIPCTEKWIENETAPLGHDWPTVDHANPNPTSANITQKSPATCTADEELTIKCQRCGETEDVIGQYAYGHEANSTAGIKAGPTCTSAGYEYYTCNDCGETFIKKDANGDEIFTEPLGHNWQKSILKQPTDLDEGIEQWHCTRCGHDEVVKIPKLGAYKHPTYVSQVVPATCETMGYIIVSCKVKGCTSCTHRLYGWKDNLDAGNIIRDPYDATQPYTNALGENEAAVDALGHLYKDQNGQVVTETIAPTCTKDGGIYLVCQRSIPVYSVDNNGVVTVTGSERCNHKELLKSIPATGHEMSDWHFVPVDQNNNYTLNNPHHYINQRDCLNKDCDYTEYELDANGNKQEYFKVTYLNPFGESAKITMSDFTVLADVTKPYTTTTLKVDMVKKAKPGRATVSNYDGETPVREATVDYGAYNFKGWVNENGSSMTATLSNLIQNTTVYAMFVGKDVYHDIVVRQGFANRGSDVLKTVRVLHGRTIPDGDVTDPDYSKFGDAKNTYTFDHWYIDNHPEKVLGSTDDLTSTQIYSSKQIVSDAKAIKKTYMAIFCDANGNDIAWTTFNYGDKLTNLNAFVDGRFMEDVDGATPVKFGDPNGRPLSSYNAYVSGQVADDVKYKYQFNGVFTQNSKNGAEYQLLDGTDEMVVPVQPGGQLTSTWAEFNEKTYDPSLSDMENGVVRFYPQFKMRSVVYYVYVNAADTDGIACEGGKVLVYDANGNQVGSEVPLDSNGAVLLRLSYAPTYTIRVLYHGEKGDTVISLDERNETPESAKKFPVACHVQATDGDIKEEGPCKCICHSFLGKIVISLFNIINKIFKTKPQCCPDMYVTQADKLKYTR